MARAGVTYLDVTRAAETIKSQGKEPTVDRVREHLQTGSKSTIAPFLKKWREFQSNQADLSGLPNELIEALKTLYNQVQGEAEKRIEEAHLEYETLRKRIEDELDTKRNDITQLSSHLQELKKQISALTRKNTSLGQSLEETRVTLAKTESYRDEATSRVTELKTSEKELKKECKDVREHFEHYQQRISDERQQEREQFRSSNQQLKAQVEGLTGQIIKAEEKIAATVKSNNELQTLVNELKEQKQCMEMSLLKTDERLTNKTNELTSLESDCEALKKQNEVLKQDKISQDKQIAVLDQSLDRANSGLSEANIKVTALSEEKALILQEKALVQGQFKQLQSSLS